MIPCIVKTHCLTSEQVMGRACAISDADLPGTTSLILVLDDIDELDFKHGNFQRFKAVIARRGSLADHASVILNGSGIQLAIAPTFPNVESGTPIFVDGETQTIAAGETDALPMAVGQLSRESTSHSAANLVYEGEPLSVLVDANNLNELRKGVAAGADGIGLLRTEWIGELSPELPSEGTYRDLFSKAASILGHRPLNIRLSDIGGDKIPNWASGIANRIRSPLSNRGIRTLALLPEMFRNQLLAIRDVSCSHSVGVVIPMVTDARDIVAAKEFAKAELGADRLNGVRWAAVIEIPSAAVLIDELLPMVDFVQFGPGDMTQFTLARLRHDISPYDLSGESMHEAVLRMAQMTLDRARAHGKRVIFCLDREPRPPLLRRLLELGVRDFSVAPSSVDRTRQRLAALCASS